MEEIQRFQTRNHSSAEAQTLPNLNKSCYKKHVHGTVALQKGCWSQTRPTALSFCDAFSCYRPLILSVVPTDRIGILCWKRWVMQPHATLGACQTDCMDSYTFWPEVDFHKENPIQAVWQPRLQANPKNVQTIEFDRGWPTQGHSAIFNETLQTCKMSPKECSAPNCESS